MMPGFGISNGTSNVANYNGQDHRHQRQRHRRKPQPPERRLFLQRAAGDPQSFRQLQFGPDQVPAHQGQGRLNGSNLNLGFTGATGILNTPIFGTVTTKQGHRIVQLVATFTF